MRLSLHTRRLLRRHSKVPSRSRFIADRAAIPSERLLLLNGFVGSVFAVADKHDAVSVLRDVVFVGDENDGVALGVQVGKERHDFLAGLGIEVSGWLVGKND